MSDQTRNMLIVDDEQDICDCLRHYFLARGFAVTSVFSGEEALAELARHPVDVVLLDILLPGISGLEVLRRVKELLPEVRVVIVSSHDGPDLREEARAHGACAFVAKPFDFSDHTWAPVLAGLGSL